MTNGDEIKVSLFFYVSIAVLLPIRSRKICTRYLL